MQTISASVVVQWARNVSRQIAEHISNPKEFEIRVANVEDQECLLSAADILEHSVQVLRSRALELRRPASGGQMAVTESESDTEEDTDKTGGGNACKKD